SRHRTLEHPRALFVGHSPPVAPCEPPAHSPLMRPGLVGPFPVMRACGGFGRRGFSFLMRSWISLFAFRETYGTIAGMSLLEVRNAHPATDQPQPAKPPEESRMLTAESGEYISPNERAIAE